MRAWFGIGQKINSNTLTGNSFTDNETPFEGNMKQVFDNTISFIERNLKKIPTEGTFNSQTVWEIPYEVFEELIVNALIHRDYFKNSPIRLFIFDNRVEIISPGRLPNSLTVEDIRFSNPVIRNNQLFHFASRTLPFSGVGSGIKRALEEQPNIEFIDMPEVLKSRYQYFTQADMHKLRAVGYTKPFTVLETAVSDYCQYLKNKTYL